MLDYQVWSFEIACPEKGVLITHDQIKPRLGESSEITAQEWEAVQPAHETPEGPPAEPSSPPEPTIPEPPEHPQQPGEPAVQPEEAPYEQHEKTQVDLPHQTPQFDPRKTVAGRETNAGPSKPGRRNAT
jgi:hypothetical protein